MLKAKQKELAKTRKLKAGKKNKGQLRAKHKNNS